MAKKTYDLLFKLLLIGVSVAWCQFHCVKLQISCCWFDCSSLSHSHNCCITFCSHLLGQRCRQDMYPVQIQRWRLHFDIYQHNWYVGGWNSYNLKLYFWAEIFHSESDTVVEIEIVNTKKMCKDSGRSWNSQRTAAADESLCFFCIAPTSACRWFIGSARWVSMQARLKTCFIN